MQGKHFVLSQLSSPSHTLTYTGHRRPGGYCLVSFNSLGGVTPCQDSPALCAGLLWVTAGAMPGMELGSPEFKPSTQCSEPFLWPGMLLTHLLGSRWIFEGVSDIGPAE